LIEPRQKRKEYRLKASVIRDWVLQISLALIIFFGFLRPYVVEAFRIPTGSMENTLLIGDHLLVLKAEDGQFIPWSDRVKPLLNVFRGDSLGLLMPATGSVGRGEILVFRYPMATHRDFIKRVVAVGGDTVRVSRDTLYVNGRPPQDYAVCFQDSYRANPIDYAWPEVMFSLEGRRMLAANSPEYATIARDTIHLDRRRLAYVVPEDHVFMMGDNRDHSNDSRIFGPLHLDLVKGEPVVTYWSWAPGHGLPKLGRIGRLIR